MTDAEVIDALGGREALAQEFGKTAQAVSNWRGRGIPWEVRPHVKDMCRRRRIKLPPDFLTTKAL